ncbi:hypothetical protein LCGC14_2056250 [marine sediment metagenome]|uniref:Uncharacterized protein n=1 Tax=marine sediment metagenome TaxID=412755 RepID=A0A0F9EMP7_9ZZZZ
MNNLGYYLLGRDILSEKSAETIANETRHGNRSTLSRMPVDVLTKTGLRLDMGLSRPQDFGEGASVTLLDIISPTFIEDEINEQSLKCLAIRVKKQITSEVQKRQSMKRGIEKYEQVFGLLCAGSLETDIADELGITRERVRQIKERLKTLQCVKKFYKELKGDYGGLKW